jgi:hypothetical protein
MYASSLGGKKFAFIIVDDYTMFTCILFLAHKNKALQAFLKIYKIVQNKKKVF